MASHRTPPRTDSPLDAAWLENEAIRALARHEKSRQGLAQSLERALSRRCQRTGEDAVGLLDELPRVLDALEARGDLDDRRFARGLLRRFENRGYPQARIASELRARGVGEELAASLVEDEESEADRRAAWRVAKQKRLGPYCTDPGKRLADRDRHLGLLGRRGFSYEIATEIVDAWEAPGIDSGREPEDA